MQLTCCTVPGTYTFASNACNFSLSFSRISSALQNAIADAAPSAIVSTSQGDNWSIRLNEAELRLSGLSPHPQGAWGG
jgi:hypothetical protein